MSDSDRDKRLDALISAAKEWADKQRKNLQDQVATSKAILKGRTGQERLAQSTVQAASTLVVDEINNFLAS